MIRYAHRYCLILITKKSAATSMNEVNASVSERSELTGNHSLRSISQSLDLINTLNLNRLL
jgi:hypothetical protein